MMALGEPPPRRAEAATVRPVFMGADGRLYASRASEPVPVSGLSLRPLGRVSASPDGGVVEIAEGEGLPRRLSGALVTDGRGQYFEAVLAGADDSSTGPMLADAAYEEGLPGRETKLGDALDAKDAKDGGDAKDPKDPKDTSEPDRRLTGRRVNVVLLPPKGLGVLLQELAWDLAVRHRSRRTLLNVPHITLKVLRDPTPEEMPEITRLVRQVAGETRPVDVEVKGVRGYGTNPEHPAVTLAIKNTRALQRLHERLVEVLAPFDRAADRRWKEGANFDPHITLLSGGDVKASELKKALAGVSKWDPRYSFKADRIHLLAREGATRYRVAAEVTLPKPKKKRAAKKKATKKTATKKKATKKAKEE
jgi:2'-5' RNA ligase